MGNMPGMDMGPPTPAESVPARDTSGSMEGMPDMPGMDHSKHEAK